MSWKLIGQSVAGTSHEISGKGCEDAGVSAIVTDETGDALLITCVSDGAGSALRGGWAAQYIVHTSVEVLGKWLLEKKEMNETAVFELLELLYNTIKDEASVSNIPLNEYSATFLTAIVSASSAIFFQIGDGAIVYNDGTGFYVPVFAPQNGEFLNTTSFLIDDPGFPQLQYRAVENIIGELALFTDGLQQLALNAADNSVYQPFFTTLFPALRKAAEKGHTDMLNEKLASYLNSKAINERTDDDKTLFLATRLPA